MVEGTSKGVRRRAFSWRTENPREAKGYEPPPPPNPPPFLGLKGFGLRVYWLLSG